MSSTQSSESKQASAHGRTFTDGKRVFWSYPRNFRGLPGLNTGQPRVFHTEWDCFDDELDVYCPNKVLDKHLVRGKRRWKCMCNC